MLMIDIDLIVQSILHPHVVIGRDDITPHVSSNFNRYRLNGCAGSSTVVLETQKTFGITALIFLDELAPCIWLFRWTMIAQLFSDDYHHDKDHFWMCIDFFFQFLYNSFQSWENIHSTRMEILGVLGSARDARKRLRLGVTINPSFRDWNGRFILTLAWSVYLLYGRLYTVEHKWSLRSVSGISWIDRRHWTMRILSSGL